jgi:hypothetical protein
MLALALALFPTPDFPFPNTFSPRAKIKNK